MIDDDFIKSMGEDDLIQLINSSQEALMKIQKQKEEEVIKNIHSLAASIGYIATLSKNDKALSRRDKRSKVSIKYRNPDNHMEVWSGRGIAPKWLQNKEKEGMNREDFLVK